MNQPSAADTPDTIRVTVAWSDAERTVRQQVLQLPPGSTVTDALRAAGLGAATARRAVGVWGRRAGPDRVLEEGDRVELYRPLRVDPKEARRKRFRRQGALTAGLFAPRHGRSKPRSPD